LPAPVTAILLAGSRPGRDPLLSGSDVATKALLPMRGKPMLRYPLAALRASEAVGHVVVSGQDSVGLAAAIADVPGVEFQVSEASIARTIERLLRDLGGPLLVTTADHVLLAADMVEHFLQGAQGQDIAVGMVEQRVLRQAGLDSRRTWLKFRGGNWSGANLFWLSGPQCIPLVRFWADIEQERKKGRRIIAAFGPALALAAALRLGDIHSLVRRAGRRFGLDARVVAMPQAEACIDADKPSDLVLIEQLLDKRYT
jgi:GTP:adenosylcobinamide-phosphate guanylyltransferase